MGERAVHSVGSTAKPSGASDNFRRRIFWLLPHDCDTESDGLHAKSAPAEAGAPARTPPWPGATESRSWPSKLSRLVGPALAAHIGGAPPGAGPTRMTGTAPRHHSARDTRSPARAPPPPPRSFARCPNTRPNLRLLGRSEWAVPLPVRCSSPRLSLAARRALRNRSAPRSAGPSALRIQRRPPGRAPAEGPARVVALHSSDARLPSARVVP
ncbi:DUF6009 family protein [Streptomyces sp. NPDC088736]|uniref:DUF6009 family protein n=1 Tax=Streptomyces sp. NPDC088736 TaxID=3365881 RepID=UPI0037F51EF4